MSLNCRIFLICAAAAACASPSLQAGFISIPQPTAAYLNGTTLAPFTDPDFTLIGALFTANETLVYNNSLEERTVPRSWISWGAPPAVESTAPRVGFTNKSSALDIALLRPAFTFGVEVSPDNQQPETISAQFFSGTLLVGTITLAPSGNNGALLYAASSSTNPFTSILITDAASGDFAIAEQRFALTDTAPEPSTLVFVTLALLFLFARPVRRLKSGI